MKAATVCGVDDDTKVFTSGTVVGLAVLSGGLETWQQEPSAIGVAET